MKRKEKRSRRREMKKRVQLLSVTTSNEDQFKIGLITLI
jgi:hypothetical protein